MEIPESIDVDGRVYRITNMEANAFRDAVGITATVLAANTLVTSIGVHAFARADALTDTGLAANETVTCVGVSAFQSIQGLRDGALPTSLQATASTSFVSVVNLRTVYLPAFLDEALRVGVKHAVGVYFRTGSEGWNTAAATFRALSLFGDELAKLIPLGAVDVIGGAAALAGESADHPYRAATGLFAAAGATRTGETGSAADVVAVTVTAADTESLEGWRVEGIELSAEQLALPTVTSSMPGGMSDSARSTTQSSCLRPRSRPDPRSPPAFQSRPFRHGGERRRAARGPPAVRCRGSSSPWPPSSPPAECRWWSSVAGEAHRRGGR